MDASSSTEPELLQKVAGKEWYRILAERGIKTDSAPGIRTEQPLREGDRYVLGVLRRDLSIRKTIQQFDILCKLLEKVPERNIIEESGISYSDYLQYHIENHFLRLTMFFDQVLYLVKTVYRIGKPEDQVFFNRLCKNEKLKGSKLVDLLKYFNERLSKARKVRNIIAHKGVLEDEELLRIRAPLELLDELPDEETKADFYHTHFKKDLTERIEKQRRRAVNDLESVAKFYFTINVLLLPEFKNQLSSLRQAEEEE